MKCCKKIYDILSAEVCILFTAYITVVTLIAVTLLSLFLLITRSGSLLNIFVETEFGRTYNQYRDHNLYEYDNTPFSSTYEPKDYNEWIWQKFVMCTATIILHLFLLLGVVFTIFLIYGIHKRRAGFVGAYLIAGAVSLFLLIIGTIFSYYELVILGSNVVCGVLLGCIFYSLYLIWVYGVYKKMSSNYTRNLYLVSENLLENTNNFFEPEKKIEVY